MKTDYNDLIVVKFFVVFLIFVSSKTKASYDEFKGYKTISPSEPPSGDSNDDRVFDVFEFGASPDADSDSTYVSIFSYFKKI